MPHLYDPAKQACDPTFHPACRGYDMCIAGPGGNRQNVENNEKGIQETGLMQVISRHQQAELGSEHDAHKQGIYRTNSMGDND